MLSTVYGCPRQLAEVGLGTAQTQLTRRIDPVTVCSVTVRNSNKRPLTDLQQAILDIVWSKGAVTAEQVREALQPARRLKDSTVRTLLRRLEARGLLTHRVEGRLFVYTAAVRRRSLAARAVEQVIDRFWAGSTEQFLLGMVDEKVIDPSTLEKLARRVKKAQG